jgi:hypothetical protein
VLPVGQVLHEFPHSLFQIPLVLCAFKLFDKLLDLVLLIVLYRETCSSRIGQ